MTALDNMIARAKSAPRHIVLAEGHDPRIIEGAVKASRDKLASITLLGPKSTIRPVIRAAGDDDSITIIDPGTSDKTATYAQRYFELRKHKGLSHDEAHKAIRNPVNFANMMVLSDDADGSIAGAVNATSDVVRSALQIIGTHQKHSLVSSFFIMIMTESSINLKDAVIYSDCGLVIDPDADQLAEIAFAASENSGTLLGLTPQIAMLSFATKDSAKHPHVDKVWQATEYLKARHPHLSVDGPLQFDAAIIPEIGNQKAVGSRVAGHANVFIFPDLNSGNIAYKITERLSGAKAIGPILQGLNKPANDLSRGCDAEAVYNMIAVTVLQAQAS